MAAACAIQLLYAPRGGRVAGSGRPVPPRENEDRGGDDAGGEGAEPEPPRAGLVAQTERGRAGLGPEADEGVVDGDGRDRAAVSLDGPPGPVRQRGRDEG